MGRFTAGASNDVNGFSDDPALKMPDDPHRGAKWGQATSCFHMKKGMV